MGVVDGVTMRCLLVLAVCCATALSSKVDLDTPRTAHTTRDGAGKGPTPYKLVFSDEFETDNRNFAEGDANWMALNSHNDGTADLEGYNQHAATTKGVKLRLTASNDSIVLDPSGTPRPYSSAMLQTWNKTCFRGGILEVSLQLPGQSDVPGMWPAVWMLGNLGRVGYGKPFAQSETADGQSAMWPYSYDTCMPHSYPNFMPPNAGQRYDACNASTIPGYCVASDMSTRDCEILMANKKLLQGTVAHGRGNPELDLLEVSVNDFTSKNMQATMSTSLQIAPVTGGNGWISRSGECYDQVFTNLSVGTGGTAAGASQLNEWHGANGAEVISALTDMPSSPFESQHVYRLEWKLTNASTRTGGLSWFMKKPNETEYQFLFDVPQAALAGCDQIGSEYRTEERPIPQEPMSLLLNLALANDFSPVPTHDARFREGFPYTMDIDYVRFYQHKDAAPEDSQCDPPEWPTTDFINANPQLYVNPNASALKVEYNVTLCNGTGPVNTSHPSGPQWHAYYDERCPSFGEIAPGGCYSGDLSAACRQCFFRPVFEELAFTANGVYGDNTSGQSKTTGFNLNPICPVSVCIAKKVPLEQCADETLPGSNTCTKLNLHFEGSTLPVKYCGNGAQNYDQR